MLDPARRCNVAPHFSLQILGKFSIAVFGVLSALALVFSGIPMAIAAPASDAEQATTAKDVAVTPPALLSPAEGSTTAAGSVAFYGTATHGAVVTVTVGGRSVTAPPTYSSGKWFAPPIEVAPGAHTVTLTSVYKGEASSPVTVERMFSGTVAAPELTYPASGSTAMAGKVSFYGTSTPGATVTLTVEDQTVTALTYSSGMWFAPPVRVSPGLQSISMTAKKGDYTSHTVRDYRSFENPLEHLELVSPAPGTITAAGSVSFYGTSTPGATVTLTVEDQTVTALTYSSGMWFAPPVRVSPGLQSISMTAKKGDYTSHTVRDYRSFGDPLERPELVSPADWPPTPAGMVSFYGTSTPGATVTLTVGDQTVTALTYSSGMWFAPPVRVSPGHQSISMTAQKGDHTSPTAHTERYFEAAVEQPELVSPADGPTTPAGMVSFYGTSTPGATVTLTVGDQTVTALTYSSGMWFAPPVRVSPGHQSISMTAQKGEYTSPTTYAVRTFESTLEPPALVSPAGNRVTPPGLVSFYGTATPGATVTLTVDGRTVTALTYSSGMWFAPPVHVTAGNQYIYMTAEKDGITSRTALTNRTFMNPIVFG